MFNKKAQTGGLITGLIFAVASLVIGVIIAFVIVSTLTGAGLLTSSRTDKNGGVVAALSKFTPGTSLPSDKGTKVFDPETKFLNSVCYTLQ